MPVFLCTKAWWVAPSRRHPQGCMGGDSPTRRPWPQTFFLWRGDGVWGKRTLDFFLGGERGKGVVLSLRSKRPCSGNITQGCCCSEAGAEKIHVVMVVVEKIVVHMYQQRCGRLHWLGKGVLKRSLGNLQESINKLDSLGVLPLSADCLQQT